MESIMTAEVTAGLFGLIGVLVGGLISWWIQKDRASTDLRIALESVKTEHMAEKTAQFFFKSQRLHRSIV
jgi:hypothetical protein